MALVDVIAIGLVGLLSLMTLNGITNGSSSNRVATLLNFLNLENLVFQNQALVLASLIALVLISRTCISAVVNKRMLTFLSTKSVEISTKLLTNILFQEAGSVRSLSRSGIGYGLTEGVDRLVVGVLGSLINIGSDFALITILVTTLVFIDPILGMTSILFFGMIGIAIYVKQGNVSASLGRVLSNSRIQISDSLFGVIDSLREVQLRGTLQQNIGQITELRSSQSRAWALMSFQPYMAKYYLEIGMVFGGVMVSGTQFVIHDAKHAIGLLSLFLAAGIRIIPSILRLHSSLIAIRSTAGVAAITIELLEYESSGKKFVNQKYVVQTNLRTSAIQFMNVNFKYPESSNQTLRSINLDINENELTAIVGPSGSGKSTLFDLALGFLKSDSGEVSILGKDPSCFVSENPGVISIVPQQVLISKDTLRNNLLLGFNSGMSDDELIQLLESLELSDILESLPNGLDSNLGEFGSRLSGGQKQRIGIARAVCTSPKFLFLDEATSSLDATTENAIMHFLGSMKSQITIVVIAHRLTTVKNADQVVYLENGEIRGKGTFVQVREQVPNFEIQAQLLGMN